MVESIYGNGINAIYDLTTNKFRTYEMCVYLFGTVSPPACANSALRQTAKDHENDHSQNQMAQLLVAFMSTTV